MLPNLKGTVNGLSHEWQVIEFSQHTNKVTTQIGFEARHHVVLREVSCATIASQHFDGHLQPFWTRIAHSSLNICDTIRAEVLPLVLTFEDHLS